jgi:hypothetical protein
MSQKDELRDRVEAKKKRILARIDELKADTRSAAREESEKLQAQLDALAETVKGRWEDLSEAVAGKLNDWLKDDES